MRCRKWLAARSTQAQQYGKPFVVEEFGKYVPRPATSDSDIARIRDPWFQDVFDIVDGSIKAGGAIHGVPSEQNATIRAPSHRFPAFTGDTEINFDFNCWS